MNFRRKKKPLKATLTLAVGRIYRVKGYWTGDFRAKCCDSLLKTVKLKVTDPMNTTLQVDDELEVAFAHAEFLPALIEHFQKPIEQRGESREEFERDRFGQSGGARR